MLQVPGITHSLILSGERLFDGTWRPDSMTPVGSGEGEVMLPAVFPCVGNVENRTAVGEGRPVLWRRICVSETARSWSLNDFTISASDQCDECRKVDILADKRHAAVTQCELSTTGVERERLTCALNTEGSIRIRFSTNIVAICGVEGCSSEQ